MLGKILKYDLKWIFKQALFLYPLLLLDALFIVFLRENSSSPFMETLYGFAQVVFAVLVVVILVITLRLAWTRMAQSMYGDEAYLVRTLPVSIKTIFSAKVLAGIICLLVNMVFCLLMVAIAHPDLYEIVIEIANATEMPVFLVALIAFVGFFAQSLFIMMAGFLGITIGYRFRNQHFAWSAVFGMATYVIGGVILMIIELTVAAFFDENMRYFFSAYQYNDIIDVTHDSVAALRNFLLIAIIGYVIYDVGCYLASRAIQERGADID